jgi:DNA-binding CsgD family transcriptional regulator
MVTTSNFAEGEPEGSWGRYPPNASKWQEQLHAVHPQTLSPALPLSARERTVATLFADDHTAEEIALVLGLSTETVRSYLTRARLKYRNAERLATNRLQLRACLVEDGYMQD